MTQEQQSGQHEPAVSAIGQEQPSPAEQAIAADIERTRAELGETVQQLADKTHVGARAKHAAADMRDRAMHAVRDLQHRGTHADAVPGLVSERARAMPATARRYWAQLAAATAALALAVLAVRKLRK
jgi:hypothetical protein